MNMICIIPARGGSKRIPKKNIRPFLGAPIISYPIEQALQSKLFSDVVVSTDDALIADVAKSYGAEIHHRSEATSSDTAETEDVIYEVLDDWKSDKICIMYPTSVFVRAAQLVEASTVVDRLVFSVTKLRGNIERAMRRGISGEMSFVSGNHNGNSQDYLETWIDAGQFYMLPSNMFIRLWDIGTRLLEMPNIGYIMRHSVDINDAIDWQLAEYVYRGMYDT